jgi:hypothetical protein
MMLGQRFRRLMYRLRRMFAPGVDNTPLVSMEHRAQKPASRQSWRDRVERYLRMAAGFALSIIVLGGAGLYYLDAASRPELDPAPTLIVPNNGSQAVAAARYLLTLRAERDAALGADRLFSPASLLRRERQMMRSAEAVAADYVAHLPVKHGGGNESLAEARALAMSNDPGRVLALERVNAAIARGDVKLDTSNAAFRETAARIADQCAKRAQALADAPADPDAAFHEARGFAFAWLILLRASASDAGELRTAPYARLSEALARASERRPNLFLRPIGGGPFAPDHVRAMALDFMLAAEAARELAAD